MSSVAASSRPGSFIVIAVFALLWNLLGVAVFLMQIAMSPEQLAALPDAQRQVYEATPGWINIAFALAVFGGVLGALGLLLRRRWAVRMFLLSLLALVVQVVASFTVTPAWQLLGASALVMPVLLLVIAIALYAYSRRAAARGWLA